MTPDPAFVNPAVEAVFAGMDAADRAALLTLRQLIFDTALRLPDVGRIEETLKWGQPAYITADTKSGTTIRLAVLKTGGVAMLTHCQTSVMSDFQKLFGEDFAFDGNRAVHLDSHRPLPLKKLGLLVTSALTYHAQKSDS